MNVHWHQLSEEQKSGMSREFWQSLSKAQQQALIDPLCIKGDGRERVAGGIYCDHHTALLQSGYRPGED
jgi:hypothetical protein